MTEQNQLQQPMQVAPIIKRAFVGAVIAFGLMTFFLLSAGAPNPDWGQFWFIRPLAVISFAGAVGGVCFHVLDRLSQKGGWRKVAAYAASFIVYVIGLWMGTVLGLVGTMWH